MVPPFESGRCAQCGAPVPVSQEGRSDGHDAAAMGPRSSALVLAIDRYTDAWSEAMRRSAEWHIRATALEQLGYTGRSAYLSVDCDGVQIPMPDGDLDYLKRHFDARLATVSAPAARAAVTKVRGAALARAQEIYRRWCRAALELGVLEASRRSERGWAAVDGLDLDRLWSAEPTDLAEVVALLRLVVLVGWEGVDGADAAPQCRALESVIAALQRMR
jgi:hypothetical protein